MSILIMRKKTLKKDHRVANLYLYPRIVCSQKRKNHHVQVQLLNTLLKEVIQDSHYCIKKILNPKECHMLMIAPSEKC